MKIILNMMVTKSDTKIISSYFIHLAASLLVFNKFPLPALKRWKLLISQNHIFEVANQDILEVGWWVQGVQAGWFSNAAEGADQFSHTDGLVLSGGNTTGRSAHACFKSDAFKCTGGGSFLRHRTLEQTILGDYFPLCPTTLQSSTYVFLHN